MRAGYGINETRVVRAGLTEVSVYMPNKHRAKPRINNQLFQ